MGLIGKKAQVIGVSEQIVERIRGYAAVDLIPHFEIVSCCRDDQQCVFRGIPDTRSGRFRTPIPFDSGQSFQSIPDTL